MRAPNHLLFLSFRRRAESISAIGTRLRRGDRKGGATAISARPVLFGSNANPCRATRRFIVAKSGFKLIDAEMHVVEPVDLWQRYIDPEFGARAPQQL